MQYRPRPPSKQCKWSTMELSQVSSLDGALVSTVKAWQHLQNDYQVGDWLYVSPSIVTTNACNPRGQQIEPSKTQFIKIV